MEKITNILKWFERLTVIFLLFLMIIVVWASTIELGVILYEQLVKPPVYLLNINELLEVFGFFLMILVAVELLETIKAYLEENHLRAEVVLLVAIIAVARKVIIIDYDKTNPTMVIAMAVVILALALGYFIVKRALAEQPRLK